MEPSRQQRVVGRDVSKAWLDGYVAATGCRFRVGNEAAGLDQLLQSLADPSGSIVVLEALGG